MKTPTVLLWTGSRRPQILFFQFCLFITLFRHFSMNYNGFPSIYLLLIPDLKQLNFFIVLKLKCSPAILFRIPAARKNPTRSHKNVHNTLIHVLKFKMCYSRWYCAAFVFTWLLVGWCLYEREWISHWPGFSSNQSFPSVNINTP